VIDASGGLVNQEEYTPYGETSFGSFSRKRYRFTGKEKDEESELYYHGARYYMSWLGRWATCDPAGMVDGLCLYSYARCNPLLLVDRSGTQSDDNTNGGDAGAPTPGGGSTEVAGAPQPTPSTNSDNTNGSSGTGNSSPNVISGAGVTGAHSDLKSSPPKIYTRKINPNNPQQAFPETRGMKPTNPDSPISIGEHSLNQHNIPPPKGSRFLSLSELPEGASTVTGDLKYIDVSKLPPDLKIHPNEAIAEDLARLVREGKIPQERADMWLQDQRTKEFEVMAEGEIPSSAVTSTRPKVSPLPGGLSVLGGGLQILGATQEENPALKSAGYGAGGVELLGGGLYIAGGQLSNAKLLVVGGGMMRLGAYGGMAVGLAATVRTRLETAKLMNEALTEGEKNGTFAPWFRALFTGASIGASIGGM
jgi:RHS repeat-associated protein